MQKPSNDAVNSTCSANASCHEGTTARNRAEDDLAACLQVEIHRLRLLDAMPNHADVIVSVYLHGGISRRSCLVGESRTELEFEFGHVTKIMEIPRPYLSQAGSESVGVRVMRPMALRAVRLERILVHRMKILAALQCDREGRWNLLFG